MLTIGRSRGWNKDRNITRLACICRGLGRYLVGGRDAGCPIFARARGGSQECNHKDAAESEISNDAYKDDRRHIKSFLEYTGDMTIRTRCRYRSAV